MEPGMGGWRFIAVLSLLACSGPMNSDFGSPQDAGPPLGTSIFQCANADISCPAGGTCCGMLCCGIHQSCCPVNGVLTCVAPMGVLSDPCTSTTTLGP
jgi:hypothetical protein